MKRSKVLFFLLGVTLGISVLIPHLRAEADPQAMRPRIRRPLLEKALELTDEQKDQLKALREKWLDEKQAFRDLLRGKSGELRDLMKDPDAHAEAVEALRDEMFEMKQVYQKNAYLHRKEIRKVFTPEQLKKLSRTERFFRRPGMRDRGMGRGFSRPSGRFSRPGGCYWRSPMRGNFWWR